MHDGQREKRTILVIDDSEVVLEMTRFTLETAGYRVLTRDRAQGSIVAILHEQPDLVLLDVNMPGMSGDSIAEILSRAGPSRGTIIVLYSSLPTNALRMRALDVLPASFTMDAARCNRPCESFCSKNARTCRIRSACT